MNIDKITPYIAAGLACAGVTFGLCYFFMGGKSENDIIKECREIIAENGNPDFDDKSAEIGMINGYLNVTSIHIIMNFSMPIKFRNRQTI